MLITPNRASLTKLRQCLIFNQKLFKCHYRREVVHHRLGVLPRHRHSQNISGTSALNGRDNDRECCCTTSDPKEPWLLPKFGSIGGSRGPLCDNVLYTSFLRREDDDGTGRHRKWSSWLIWRRDLSSTNVGANNGVETLGQEDELRARRPSKGKNKSKNSGARNDSPGGGVKERRTLDQVVYHLQADIRRRRRIHKAEINNAVDLVEEASRVDDFGSFLLKCCCDLLPDLHPSYRVALAERIWAVIQKSKDYSAAHFESMLKALAVNEDKSADPFTFLDEARGNSIEVTGTMYFFALLILCQRGDIEAVVKLLTLMKEDNLSVNERFFNVLIIGNARRGDLKGAAEILEIMRASQIEPSGQTWTSLLQAYIEAGDDQLVRKTFSENVGVSLTEDQFQDLVKIAGRRSEQKILDLIIDRALESNKMHYLSIMNVCVKLMYEGHSQNALKLVLKFKEALSAKKEPLGAFFIKELHATNLDSGTYLNLIMSLQGNDHNPYALNMAAESCLKHKKPHLAFAIYEGMSVMNIPVRPHYFIPPLVIGLEQSGINGAVQVLKKMQAMHVKPDWEMLFNWIIPMILDVEENIIEVLKLVQEASGISYSSGLLSAGLAVTIGRGQLNNAIKIVDTLKVKLTHPEVIMQKLLAFMTALPEGEDSSLEQPRKMDISAILKILKYVTDNLPSDDKTDYVGAFLLKLIDSDRVEETAAILNGASSVIGISISTSELVAATIKEKLNVEGIITVNPELEWSQGAPMKNIHPNRMDIANLECHKEELEAKSLNARGTYRKLFLKYCQAGDLQKAIEIKEKFQEEFGPLSSGMKSALIGNYIQNKVLKPALQLYDDIIKVDEDEDDKVELDTYKLVDLATLLIEKGFVEDGIKFIESECLTRTHRRQESFQRNVIRLLKTLSVAETNSISENKSEDNVTRLTELFLSEGLMKACNPTLAPSIKNLCIRGQLEEAVSRLEMYSKKYKLTPSLQELTYATLKNPQLLDRVVRCSTAVKGLRESRRLLALAKSDVGDLDGAAAIFRELAGQLSFVSLINQCEYLATRRDIDKLLNLINSLIKTGRNYDCTKLYDIATKSCHRSGDQDSLKKILLNMEENDQYVSPALKEFAGQQRS